MNKKKLLILGANFETIPLLEEAKKLGYFVVVSDNVENAPAKNHADEALDIDGTDIGALEEYARERGIDGVLVGVADSLLTSYAKLCLALKLPSYGTIKQMQILSNKLAFNQLIEEYGLSAIPYSILNVDKLDFQTDNTVFPILIKPVDSSAGKGISVVRKAEFFNTAIAHAVAHSRSNKILVEDFMDLHSIGLYFTIKDGKYFLSAIFDRYTINISDSGVVSLFAVYPSKYAEIYIKTVHAKILKVFKALKLKNGVLMLCAFIKEGKFFIFDPGFRLQGEGADFYVKLFSNFDQKKAFINLAVTGNFNGGDVDLRDSWDFNGNYVCTVWVLVRAGEIKEVYGISSLRKMAFVISIEQRLNVGDIVEESMVGTERQVFARIRVIGESRDQLRTNVGHIIRTLKIFDSNGKILNINEKNLVQ